MINERAKVIEFVGKLLKWSKHQIVGSLVLGSANGSRVDVTCMPMVSF